MIETLQSFIQFEPTEVFHGIAKVIHSAQGWGYQYESMAVELLVKITENYLAEYPQRIQEDPSAREELVDLSKFSSIPDEPTSQKLSYRMEEKCPLSSKHSAFCNRVFQKAIPRDPPRL